MVNASELRLQAVKDKVEKGGLTKCEAAHIIGECIVDTYVEYGADTTRNILNRFADDVKFVIETNDFISGLYERAEDLGYYDNVNEKLIDPISAMLTYIVA